MDGLIGEDGVDGDGDGPTINGRVRSGASGLRTSSAANTCTMARGMREARGGVRWPVSLGILPRQALY
ncbi:hypothetical protein CCHR01_04919 [Colletotrichum chrysophilum]|uniref:Uncharacterized protein n=1 Tax=Colletotrichum chrysophilum TaxID=1836956 RepID=A0AAD9AS33_9PEZI|nr:hypothetical protein CCHR01_04919 [Colletotrichum chrysophilum]